MLARCARCAPPMPQTPSAKTRALARGLRHHSRTRVIALALGFAAGSGVEAEAVRELARGFQHERCDFFLDALGGEPERRRGDGDRADDVARVVADRSGDGADLLEVLAEI